MIPCEHFVDEPGRVLVTIVVCEKCGQKYRMVWHEGNEMGMGSWQTTRV